MKTNGERLRVDGYSSHHMDQSSWEFNLYQALMSICYICHKLTNYTFTPQATITLISNMIMRYKDVSCVIQILPLVERIICRVFIWMVRVKCSNINRPRDTFNCGRQRGQRLIFSQTTDRLTVVMVSDVPCPTKLSVWEKRQSNKGVNRHVWINRDIVLWDGPVWCCYTE